MSENIPMAAKQAQVPGELSELSCVIDDLDKSMATLAEKLKPIMSPSRGDKAPSANPQVDGICQLANDLSVCTIRLRALRNMLGDVFSRIEV